METNFPLRFKDSRLAHRARELARSEGLSVNDLILRGLRREIARVERAALDDAAVRVSKIVRDEITRGPRC